MELDARLVRLPALLHLEDLDLVAVLQTAGLGDVLLVEASAVEGEADVLSADALPLAVGIHQLPERGGLLDLELYWGPAGAVRHTQVDVFVVSTSVVHLGLGVCRGFSVVEIQNLVIKYFNMMTQHKQTSYTPEAGLVTAAGPG